MNQLYRNSLVAVILIVVLRLSVGWHLLYEGLWKLDTLDTAQPWTSAGYLRNSEGPARDVFRSMAGDPDDLDWLNYDAVVARWDDWAERFVAHYDLSDDQKKKLTKLIEGNHGMLGDRRVYAAELESLPKEVTDLNQSSGVSDRIVWFDAKRKRLYVDKQRHLLESERDKLMAIAEDDEAWKKAVEQVYLRQKRGIGYTEKLAGALRGDPELVGNEKWQRLGRKEQYEVQLARYEEQRSAAKTDFQWDHLNSDWRKIQVLRAEITAPVKALDADLKESAAKLLTAAQLSLGPESRPWTVLRLTDVASIAGLIILGAMLILGVFTRLAAVVAAFMLFNFYLALPPFPGVPELLGPEHAFIVNKNLIEVIVLLVVAALPTGRWFGVDAWLAGLMSGKSKQKATA